MRNKNMRRQHPTMLGVVDYKLKSYTCKLIIKFTRTIIYDCGIVVVQTSGVRTSY